MHYTDDRVEDFVCRSNILPGPGICQIRNTRMLFRIQILTTAALLAAADTPHAYSLPEILAKAGPVRTETLRVPALNPAKTYSVLFSINSPAVLSPDTRIEVTLADGATVLASKTLHLGDPDFYAPFHVNHVTRPELRIKATSANAAHYTVHINEWPDSPSQPR